MYYDYRLAAAQSRMDDFRRDAARRRLSGEALAPRRNVARRLSLLSRTPRSRHAVAIRPS